MTNEVARERDTLRARVAELEKDIEYHTFRADSMEQEHKEHWNTVYLPLKASLQEIAAPNDQHPTFCNVCGESIEHVCEPPCAGAIARRVLKETAL